MLEVVTERLNDQAEIVQKTAKKLVLEMHKNYAEHLPCVLEKFASASLRSKGLEVLGYAQEAASEAQSNSFTVNRNVEEEKTSTIPSEVPPPQRLLGPSTSSMGIHNAYGYCLTSLICVCCFSPSSSTLSAAHQMGS